MADGTNVLMQLAQANESGEAIGKVQTFSGEVIIVRADGAEVKGGQGTEIFQGDVVRTGDGGEVSMVFADDTTFSLGEQGEMTIDEMVYDPGSESGSAAFSVAQGVFGFVSGQLAKVDPDAMVIDTPVATIGIRGSSGTGTAGPEGNENTFILVPDPDGTIGEIIIQTETGSIVMNVPYQTSQVLSAFISPTQPVALPASVVNQVFGNTVQALAAARQDAGIQDTPPAAAEAGSELEAAVEAADAATGEAAAAAEQAFQEALAAGGSLVDAFRAAASASEEKGAEAARRLEEEQLETDELLAGGVSIDSALDQILQAAVRAQEGGFSLGEEGNETLELGAVGQALKLDLLQLDPSFYAAPALEALLENGIEGLVEVNQGRNPGRIDTVFRAEATPQTYTFGNGDDKLKFTDWAHAGHTVRTYDNQPGQGDQLVFSGLSLKSVSTSGGTTTVKTVNDDLSDTFDRVQGSLDLTANTNTIFSLEGPLAGAGAEDWLMDSATDASNAVTNLLSIYGQDGDKELTFATDNTPLAANGVEVLLVGQTGNNNAGVYRFVDSDNDGKMDTGEVKLLAWLEGKAAGAVTADDFSFASDPLIFDLDGDGVTLTAAQASFDVDADGAAEKTGWMDSGDAMLVIDENSDGVINDMTEVVSSYLSYGGGKAAGKSSLDALAQFDDNGDGVINSEDAVWSVLKLWKDANGDGQTDDGELLTLADYGITRIGLNGEDADREEPGGTVHRTAEAVKADGETVTVAEVSFDSAPADNDDPTAGTSV